LTIQYETEKKEQENELLKKEGKLKEKELAIQEQLKTFFVILSIISLAGLLLLYRNYQLKKQNNQLLKEENDALVFEKDELKTINTLLQKENKHLKVSKTVSPPYKIQSVTRTHLVQPEDIKYVKSEREGCKFFLKNDDKGVWSDIPLKTVLESLPDALFIRIFRSTIVNKNHIKWVNHNSLALKDGTELKISKTYRENIIGLLD